MYQFRPDRSSTYTTHLAIETIPSEIQQQLQSLKEKDGQLEGSLSVCRVRVAQFSLVELQRNLFKKRSVLMKAQEKGLDEAMQLSLRRRADKDANRAAALLEEKAQIQQAMLQILNVHMQRLEKDVYRPLGLELSRVYEDDGPFGSIPDPDHAATAPTTPKSQKHTANLHSGSGTPLNRISPKKRASLLDEPPTDPNEPVYCTCRQVSYGDMIACDNPTCNLEWFHYTCVGLTSPPTGKWYCNECSTKLNL